MGHYIFNTLSVWASLPVTSWCQIKGPSKVEMAGGATVSPFRSTASTPPPSLHKRHFYHATTSYKYLVSTIITIQTDLGRVCLTSSFVRWMFLDSKSLESSCAWRMWENQRIVIFFKAFLIQIQHLRDMMFFFCRGVRRACPVCRGHDVIHPILLCTCNVLIFELLIYLPLILTKLIKVLEQLDT